MLTIELPTRIGVLSAFADALAANGELELVLPPPGANRAPDLPTLLATGNLLSQSAHLERIVLRQTLDSSQSPNAVPRSLSRAGIWDTLHRCPARIECAKGSEALAEDLALWDPEVLPDPQERLFWGEIQWRPTASVDIRSRRLEHQVGIIDRPEQLLVSFDNADSFATSLSAEVADVAAGAGRGSPVGDEADFGRLLAKAISTLVENVDEHAYDFGALASDTRLVAQSRRRQTSLIVALTRGGGTRASKTRQSMNRVRLITRDNGISIPTTVRGRGRLRGLTDSEEILRALLRNSLTEGQRPDLRGLGYPELLELANEAVKLGWYVSMDILTQASDKPGSMILASHEVGPRQHEETSVSEVAGTPFVGTSVAVTIRVPGSPDWLSGLLDEVDDA